MRFIAKVFLVVSLASTSLFSTAFATDHTVLMNGDYYSMFFDPASITVTVGDRIRWQNVVAVLHTATSGDECTPNAVWASVPVNPGATSEYVTFNTVGTFPYFCRFHCDMGMVGEITVKPVPVPVKPRTWGSVKALYAALTSL